MFKIKLIQQFLVLLPPIFIGLNTTAVASNAGWERIRTLREKKIKQHLATNPEGFSTFINGSIGQGPMPALMFAMLPELFPTIWGPASGNMQQIGLTKNTYFTNHQLPLGIGMELMSLENVIGEIGKNRQLHLAGFNCVACHAGKVETAHGKYKTILGAPNTRINNVLFLFARTVTHPDFNADKIMDHLREKPLGSIYGPSAEDQELEALDRKVLMEEGVAQALVDKMRAKGQVLLGAFEKFIRPRTYDAAGQSSPDPYALKRGTMDAFLPLHLAFISTFATNPAMLDAGLPKYTSETDAPSIWRQRNRGGVGHWDGNHLSPIHRNVGAAAAGLNNPVNVKSVDVITKFIQDLPAEPYPFEVNLAKAKRGKDLYQQNCMGCHTNQNQVYPIAKLGTDANRLNSITPIAAGFLANVHISLCNDATLCSKSDGAPYLPEEITKKTDGYAAGPLDGLWARAPYLHNGSIPTLYALLTGDRPKQFYRGNIKYDRHLVGFKWDEPGQDGVLYDTQLSGNSNSGHSGQAFLGFDPKKEPQKLWDLLEYLKTL